MVSKTTIGSSVMLWGLPRPGIKGGQRDKIRCCGPHPLEHGLQDGVEVLIAPRHGSTVGHLWESHVLAQLWVVLEPAVLGFEVKNPPLLHDHEEHDQGLMLVDKRPSAMR